MGPFRPNLGVSAVRVKKSPKFICAVNCSFIRTWPSCHLFH